VDANGGSCSRAATPTAYSDQAACASLDAANDVCQNGDLVLVQAGAYGDQTISGSNARTSSCTIQAVPGAVVTFHTLTTNGNWLTLKDLESHTGESEHLGIGGCVWCDQNGGSHLVLDNVDLFGKWANGEINDATDVTWKNSQLGTPGNTADRLCGQDDLPFRISGSTNVVIDHNTFHPFRGATSGCGADVYHLETFRLWDTNDGITFSNNRFDDNNGDDSFTISSSKGGCGSCPDNKNLRFVNNYFGAKCCGYEGADIGFGDGHPCTGFVFAYNFFKDNDAGVFNNCSSQTNMVYVGNIGFNQGGCPVSGVNSGNLWYASSHGSCPGNAWLSASFPNPGVYGLAADGLHLAAGSPVINAGETSYCSLWANNLDIDAQPRSGVCDAGPDEFVGP
jgi:hypothetical protein